MHSLSFAPNGFEGELVRLVVHFLEAGLLVWMALLAAILIGRVMRGDMQSSGGFMHRHRDKTAVAPERALSMAVFPVVVVSYAFSALHADASITHSLPDLSNNMLMLLTGGNGVYLAGKIARTP